MHVLPSWADINLLLPNIFFGAIAIIMLWNSRTQIPRTSSIPNSIALLYLGITTFCVGYYWAGTMTTINGVLWAALAIYRPTPKKIISAPS